MQHFKKIVLVIFCFSSLLSAQAALKDRGNGMVYDSDLDVTWLVLHNYAKTSGYIDTITTANGDGRMTWSQATAWAEQLVYGGFADWRLPKTLVTDTSCSDYDDSLRSSGHSCTGSEMGHLVDIELGHVYGSSLGNSSAPDLALFPVGFVNTADGYYWSGTWHSTIGSVPRYYVYYFSLGLQSAKPDSYEHEYLAIAVRDGDVTNPVNLPPLANAGIDQTVNINTVVNLDGDDSYDPDNHIPLNYSWNIISQPEGSAATLDDSSIIDPSFIVDLPGDYVVQLIVTDTLSLSSTADTVRISSLNSAPVADAGDDQLVDRIGELIQLDGSTSFDNDGDELTYQWRLINRPVDSQVILSDAISTNPIFMADMNGTYIVELVVTDIYGASSNPDQVLISFNQLPPIANAGVNQSVLVGDAVILNGANSSDLNNDPLSFQWGFTSLPEGSNTVLLSPDSPISEFIADMAGDYVISLTVSDGQDANSTTVMVVAITTEQEIAAKLMQLIDTVNGIDRKKFKNKRMKKSLTKKINRVLKLIQRNRYRAALNKLQFDVLRKTNGCAIYGRPDSGDWIRDCETQEQIYSDVSSVIDYLKN